MQVKIYPQTEAFSRFVSANGLASVQGISKMDPFRCVATIAPSFCSRFMSTKINSVDSSQGSSAREPEVPERIKFKRLDKTGRHIMQACDCSVSF